MQLTLTQLPAASFSPDYENDPPSLAPSNPESQLEVDEEKSAPANPLKKGDKTHYCDLCDAWFSGYQTLYRHQKKSISHLKRRSVKIDHYCLLISNVLYFRDDEIILYQIGDIKIKQKAYKDLLSKTQWLDESVSYFTWNYF